jgi:hypothetical protein
MIAALFAAIILTFQSFAHASPQPRGSTFAATVEDGTPHVIRVKKTQISEEESQVVESDGKEEYLESLVQKPASVPRAAPSAESLDALKGEVEALKAQLQAMKAESNLAPAPAAQNPTPAQAMVAPAPDKQLRTAGERVPEAHKGEMSKRISAASQILKKYGIAYDYRVMTLKDFIRIEARLSKGAAEKNQGDSAPSESLSEN